MRNQRDFLSRLSRALLLALAASCLPAAAQGPAFERGRALYEARCDKCHDTSVHRRNPRSAGDFAQIRAFVVRWDRELGALWRDDEIDAVARYLNERYYHYPCPQTVCVVERAQARPAGGSPASR